MIFVDWIVKKENKKNLQVLWDVFLTFWTLWGLGRDNTYIYYNYFVQVMSNNENNLE